MSGCSGGHCNTDRVAVAMAVAVWRREGQWQWGAVAAMAVAAMKRAATVVPAVGWREGACGGAAGGRRLGWGTAAGQGREGRGRWRRVRAVEAATGDGGGGGGGRGAAFAAAIAAGVATCAAATRRPAPLTRAPPTHTLGRRPSVRTAAAPLTSQHNQVLQAVEAGGGHARASQCARVRQGTPSDTPGDALVSSHSSGLP